MSRGTSPPALYRRHRFPAEIISHCVWLYYRFLLSYRDVEGDCQVNSVGRG